MHGNNLNIIRPESETNVGDKERE